MGWIHAALGREFQLDARGILVAEVAKDLPVAAGTKLQQETYPFRRLPALRGTDRALGGSFTATSRAKYNEDVDGDGRQVWR